MKHFCILSLLLCLGMIPLSCTKPDNTDDGTPDTGDENTPDESLFIGIWAILNEEDKAVSLDVIGKDMKLTVYNASDASGYGFSNGIVSAELTDFKAEDYVYDVDTEGNVTFGNSDISMKLSLESDNILNIITDGITNTAYRVTKFAGKPSTEVSIVGTWDVTMSYFRESDGSISEESPGEGEYFIFTETEMSLCLPGENPEIYSYTLDNDIISFNDYEGYLTQYQILELTETTLSLYVDYDGSNDISGYIYSLNRRR